MTRNGLRTIGLGFFVVFSATIVAFLSFISIELSVAVFAVASVVFAVMVERVRRMHWEQAVDFKFQAINKKHDALSKQVMHNQGVLDDVKTDNAMSFKTLLAAAEGRDTGGSKQSPHRAANEPFANPQPIQAMQRKPMTQGVKRSAVQAPSLRVPPSKTVTKTAGKEPLKQSVKTLPKDDILKRRPHAVTVIEDSDSLSDVVVEELTNFALNHQRIDIFMQPIMRMPQRQRKFYELFSRVRAKPGVYIPAARYMEAARKNDQMQDIDALLIGQCLELLKHSANTPDQPSFFVNITASTLKNALFMSKLLPVLSKNRDLAKRLVFEMHQKEFHDLPIPILQVIGGLAKLGCSFSLDHVTKLNEDILDLQRFNVRFIKADASIFVDSLKDDRKYKGIMKAKRLLEGNGIGLIVEKIEDESVLRNLLDYNLNYAQGYLFGRPDLQSAYEPVLKRRISVQRG